MVFISIPLSFTVSAIRVIIYKQNGHKANERDTGNRSQDADLILADGFVGPDVVANPTGINVEFLEHAVLFSCRRIALHEFVCAAGRRGPFIDKDHSIRTIRDFPVGRAEFPDDFSVRPTRPLFLQRGLDGDIMRYRTGNG